MNSIKSQNKSSKKIKKVLPILVNIRTYIEGQHTTKVSTKRANEPGLLAN